MFFVSIFQYFFSIHNYHTPDSVLNHIYSWYFIYVFISFESLQPTITHSSMNIKFCLFIYFFGSVKRMEVMRWFQSFSVFVLHIESQRFIRRI